MDSATECIYAKGITQIRLTLEPGVFDQAVVDRLLGGKGDKIDALDEVAYTQKVTYPQSESMIGLTLVWAKGQYLKISMFTPGGLDPVQVITNLARLGCGSLGNRWSTVMPGIWMDVRQCTR